MRSLIIATLMILATTSVARAHIDPLDVRYENTFAKDFIMDAPWRVMDANTPIPVTVIIKDCDVDDVRELHSIHIWDETATPTTLWYHNFNDETLGDDPSEQNFWSIITKVSEGSPLVPNGTLLTPASLGYAAGDVIKLGVEIYYLDSFLNYTETRHLRVRVGDGPFPWPAGWYGGDVHYHTMYTNNPYEYGAPLPAVKESARAMGLHWLTATDHSSDLDETGDGTYGYATPQWEYTMFDQSGARTYYRDVAADGGTWQGLGVDVSQLDGPDFRLYRGTELNVASIDPASWDKTLHCLIYNDAYIHSPYSGAPGERPVSVNLSNALGQIQGTGFAYSSHPINDLTADVFGFDVGANGSAWGVVNIAEALNFEAFRGLQIFNTRATVTSTDQNNPWAAFDARVPVDEPYPQELLTGVDMWDRLVALEIADDEPRRIFVAGGSDAHGDFNYASHLGFDDYADDNAMGKAQTVAFVPGDWSPTNLPPMTAILAAYRAGNTIITDGPFVEIGIDTDGDSGWYGPQDLVVGQAGSLPPNTTATLHLRWDSLPEFGSVASVKLIAVDAAGATTLDTFTNPPGLSGNESIALGNQGFSGRVSFRAELLTNDGHAGHRAYTNPIEVNFVANTSLSDPRNESPTAPTSRPVYNTPNPFNPRTSIHFSLGEDSPVSVNIYSLSGRLVRRIIDSELMERGDHSVEWDGIGEQGQSLPSGVYLYTISTDQRRHVGKMSLVR